MTKTRTYQALAGIGIGVILLAGCSAGDETADASASADTATSAAPEASGQPQAGGDQGDFQPSGVSGEVAYVADGTAQVQDDDSQTAVRFTDDTTVTTEVDVAFADIVTGQCVVAVIGDDDIATSVSVSEADEDGTCSTGFGGMGGERPEGMEMPDGEVPSDMPTAMPDGMEMPDGEVPTDMPTAMPEGGDMSQGGFGGSFVSGAVTAAADGTLTVEDSDGEATEVVTSDETTITGTEETDTSAIEVGLCMTANGESDSSGGYDATTIALSEATDEGCTSGFGGGGMGMGGPGGGMSDELDSLDTAGE
ncbi:MAG: hypothetical protein ACK5IM_03040 [Demequina sp.]|uniref:hypothetical protein n=1 Tax=Demequina sp. TaxID=2050685 RepID=UPI003A893B15